MWNNFLRDHAELNLHVFCLWEFVIGVIIIDVDDDAFLLFVETALLNNHFAVMIVAVGVMSISAKLSKFPPTVNLVL